MTWLRFAASPQLAGIAALTAAASLGACHLIGGAGDLTFEDGVGGSGAGSTGTTAGGGNEGLPLGSDCSEAPDGCASGFCVDDVCCDTACEGECSTCVASGNEGTCSPDIGASCGDTNVCDGAGVCSTGDLQWAVVGGTNMDEFPGRGAIDGAALRFVGGSVTGPVEFGPLNLPGSGNNRSFVGRIDDVPEGTIEGLGRMDGTQRLEFIARFPDGGYVVAGLATGSFDLTPAQDLDVGTKTEPVVIAFEPDGTPDWGKVIPTTPINPRVLALAASETHVAVAFTDETTGATRNRLTVLSRSGGGVIQDLDWDLGTTVGTGGELTGLTFSPMGELWAAGWCLDRASIETATSQIQVGPTSDRTLPILVHYDQGYDVPTGGAVAFGGTADTSLFAVSVSEDTIYVSGTLADGVLSQNAVEGDDPVELVADAAGDDPFVLALDEIGLARWAKSFVSNAEIEVPGLAHDDAGNVVIGGLLNLGQVTFAQTPIGSTDSPTSFIVKLVPGGGVAWARSDSNTLAEPRVNWVGIDNQGRTWVTGDSTGDLVFGQPGLGSADMMLLRFAP